MPFFNYFFANTKIRKRIFCRGELLFQFFRLVVNLISIMFFANKNSFYLNKLVYHMITYKIITFFQTVLLAFSLEDINI